MIISFILGVIEFRSCVTTHTRDMLAYDWGREMAHVVTLRWFERS